MSRVTKAFSEKLLIGLLCGVAVMVAAPTIAGYGGALAALPALGAFCGFDKLFGSAAATPDEYRSFLLGRGCSIDAAISGIAIGSGASVDPRRIVAIYHGAQRAETGDELSAMSAVHDALKHFASSDAAKDPCAPNEDCTTPAPLDNVVDLLGAYPTFARSRYLDALDDGADSIGATLRMGLAGQAIVLMVYAAAVLVMTKKAIDLLIFGISLLSKKQSPKR